MPEASTATAADPNSSTSTASTTVADPNSAATTTQAESWAREWVQADGSFNHKAFEKAPEELRPLAKDLERYKSMDEYVKGHRELLAMASKKGLFEALPANATQAQVQERAAQLRKITGAPDKPEGYGLQRPADIPEGVWDQNFANEVAKIAYEEGFSPGSIQRLMKAETEYTKRAMDTNKANETAFYQKQDELIRMAAAKEGLNYDKVSELAARAGKRFGISPENPVMKNASVMLALSRVGKLISEDSIVTGDTSDFHTAANMSAEQAEKETTRIKTDPTHPMYNAYWNRKGADGKFPSSDEVDKARAQARKLSQIAYATRPTRGAR